MSFIYRHVLPQYCLLCIEKTLSESPLCAHCLEELPWLCSPHCSICAKDVPDKQKPVCGACAAKAPPFDTTHCTFRYQEPISHWIKQFKFHQQLHLTKTLARLMASGLKRQRGSTPIDAIVPIPLHYRRWIKRGYNQTILLAKHLQTALQRPMDRRVLKKRRHTKPQALKKRQQRQIGLKGVFYAKPNRYKRVALIDDVMTTGATVSAAAMALRQTGIKYIEVWCLARS